MEAFEYGVIEPEINSWETQLVAILNCLDWKEDP